MIQQELDTYYEKLITDIALVNSDTEIYVTRVNTANNSVHQIISHVLDLNETDTTSINFVNNKPVDKTIPSVLTYTVQPNDRVIYDSSTEITYIHKDGELYIIRDAPVDNAFIRVPNFKTSRLYKGMSVVKFTNGRMYMSTKPTVTIPLSGNSDWVEVTEFDMFIARCEIDTESLAGSLTVEYLDILGDGSNVVAHYTLSNSSLGDLLGNHVDVEAFPTSRSIEFSPSNSTVSVGAIYAGLRPPDTLNVYALKSGSLRFTLDQLPTSDSSIVTISQGDVVSEYCVRISILSTGEITLSYRTEDNGAITTISSGVILTINTEYSLVYTVDDTSIKIYLDDSSDIINHTLATAITSIPLGIFIAVELDETPSFNGTVRDIRLYDSTLTHKEAQEVYSYGN